jgi:hypothetical protein
MVQTQRRCGCDMGRVAFKWLRLGERSVPQFIPTIIFARAFVTCGNDNYNGAAAMMMQW